MRVFLSYGVHLFTISGVFFSFLALIASIERNLPLVFFYLAIALFIDGVDGSLARRVDVKRYTPKINGENLDNIIDYLNYVFLPAFVIYWLDLVPEGFELISAATILVVSCYTFANNSKKTSQICFRQLLPGLIVRLLDLSLEQLCGQKSQDYWIASTRQE